MSPFYVAQVWISSLNHLPIRVFVGDCFQFLQRSCTSQAIETAEAIQKWIKKKKINKVFVISGW